MALSLERAPSRVIVHGVDPVVGRALELLLRSAGYGATFVTADSLDEPSMLDGARLLLFFAVDPSPERRKVSLSLIKSAPGMAGVPILEVVSSPDKAQAGIGRPILWPCRIEELRRRIEAALLDGSSPEEREVNRG